MQKVFKLISLVNRLDLNRYYYSGFKVDLRVMPMKLYSILFWSLKLEPYHQMQFSVIHKTPLFEGVFILCREYGQHIQSPPNTAFIVTVFKCFLEILSYNISRYMLCHLWWQILQFLFFSMFYWSLKFTWGEGAGQIHCYLVFITKKMNWILCRNSSEPKSSVEIKKPELILLTRF